MGSNDEVFDWDNVVIQLNEFDLVDDTIETSPPLENENPQDEGDEGYGTEQEYSMDEIQEELDAVTLDDYDGFGF